jgi:hypothetical protein
MIVIEPVNGSLLAYYYLSPLSCKLATFWIVHEVGWVVEDMGMRWLCVFHRPGWAVGLNSANNMLGPVQQEL